MPVSVVCGECKKEFEVKPYQVGIRIWCSVACKNAASRVGRTCQHCAKEFWIFKSQERKGLGQFCSKACRDLSRTLPKPEPKPKTQPVVKICETCEKVFVVPFCRSATAKYCSKECKYCNQVYLKNQSLKQAGENHWRWSGGTYTRSCGYTVERSRSLGNIFYVREHRKIMIEWILEVEPTSKFLIEVDGKITLHQDVEVHHIDRNRSNNARENLLAVTTTAHQQIHHHGTKPKPFECWPHDPQKW